MTSFVLVPGAGGRGWYWHRVAAALATGGHRAFPVDLPGADPEAGLSVYRDRIGEAARSVGGPVTIVAQSLGGFSAPLVCGRAPVERLILVNAMVPLPGETAGEWWEAVGWQAEAEAKARREGRSVPDVGDVGTLLFHDLPAEIVEVLRSDPQAAAESPAVFADPWFLDAWPDVPTIALAARDDRFFPVPLQRRVARLRLDIEVEEVPGGHLVALSHPAALADRLVASCTQ